MFFVVTKRLLIPNVFKMMSTEAGGLVIRVL